MENSWKIYKRKKYNLEKDYEQILKQFPYLIDDNFSHGKITSQYPITLDNGANRFIDIISIGEKEIHVAELKRGKIKTIDISQLSEYVQHFRKNFIDKSVSGYLIGDEINERDLGFLEQKGFEFKQYNKDIPLNIKICKYCRKAVKEELNDCPHCNKSDFLPY